MSDTTRYITVAIHTYEKALSLRSLLESEGIVVELNNVNLEMPGFSSGVRVRIPETDLPLALRIIENRELFDTSDGEQSEHLALVPVDLTELSYKAARVAINLAKSQGARITFLYSYIDPYIAGNVHFTDNHTYEVGETGARKALGENARKLLDNFIERLRSEMKQGTLPAVKYSSSVVEGVPEDAIAEYSRAHRPYMIVMGTRGADRKNSEMIGSVTAEVLDQGRFTVLTVPAPVKESVSLQPSSILFFSNLEQDDILAIDALYRLFGATNAKVTIMHIPSKRRFSTSSADKALRRLSEYCEKNFTHYHFLSVPVSNNASERYFNELQKEHDFDLIVVPNRRRNAFSRLFNPDLAHKLLFNTDIPMLVIPV
ncbi:MAG: universal stress protein [Muribaculaceae bacterium]|nr:universal stress protein [Muribaculaceae bacterium]